MSKWIVILSVLSTTALTGVAFGAPQSQTNGDGNDSDGCGLGWQVTQKKTLVGTATRGTTNAFVPPTFGMTTGTIGCKKHEVAKNDMAAATYAVNNYESLTVELAEGHGEYVSSFARTFGCNDSSLSQFSNMTQTHYEKLMKANNGIELFENVKQEIQQNPELAASCNTAVL